ncbi:MAG: fimbrial assembly protein [Zetaproteobacteria bacterium]|nr:MAG: fimbrial assembly protein [Zetaproteobacteria bacterium]
MIRINLLPYRAALRRRQVLRELLVGGGVLLIFLLLLTSWHLFSQARMDAMQRELTSLQAKNRAIERKIGEIRNIERLRREVESKLRLVDQLQTGRFRVLLALHEIARRIPDDVWLLSLQDQGHHIQLTGRAESNKAVAVLMRRLDASALFAEVRLQGITRQRVAGHNVREFKLLLSRAGGKETQVATRQGKVR